MSISHYLHPVLVKGWTREIAACIIVPSAHICPVTFTAEIKIPLCLTTIAICNSSIHSNFNLQYYSSKKKNTLTLLRGWDSLRKAYFVPLHSQTAQFNQTHPDLPARKQCTNLGLQLQT